MTIELADYDRRVRKAIKASWLSRDTARQKQLTSGKADQGERSAVTAGKNMHGFISLMIDIIKANELTEAVIRLDGRLLTLPGFFRPTKLWDLLVLNNGRLIAALEFKSQVGPSFGNNFNNRAEEAIGTAVDLWTAYREGAFGEIPRPFVGWLMLVEDAPKSRSKVRDQSPNFPIFPEFKDSSYLERYNVLCKKLAQEGLYSSAAVIASSKSAAKTGEYQDMSELTSLKNFVTSFAAHIAVEAAKAKS